MENTQIIEQLRSGSPSRVIGELYAHFPKIRALILSKGGNKEDAKDVFQDALLILCRNAEKPEFELTASPGTYLYSVARFLWKDILNKRNREVSWDSAGQQLPGTEEMVELFKEEEPERKMLEQILHKVGEKCMQLLKMYYYERLHMTEIAKRLKFSSDKSAKTQKYKCMERARKIALNIQLQPQN